MSVRLEIDDPSLHALEDLYTSKGRRIRLVGGAVRDMLMGLKPKDRDLATDALPEETIAIAQSAGLRVIPTGLRHGTVTVMHGDEGFELTTLRRDVETDGRHAEVEFVRDFEVDAARRDFTINAMSASIGGEVFDYFGGLDDLHARRVRFVGRAEDRIEEDYLRILRFFRFMTRFGGSGMDTEARAAIAKHHPGLGRISGERIWMELSRILSHPEGWREVSAMKGLGVLDSIGLGEVGLQRIARAKLVRHHGGDAALCLGCLLGTEEAIEAAYERWGLSNRERSRALLAAKVDADRDPSPKRWLIEAVNGMDALSAAVVLEATGRQAAAAELRMEIPSFPLRGKDVVAAGMSPGPDVGAYLAAKRREWIESDFAMTAEELLADLRSALGFGL